MLKNILSNPKRLFVIILVLSSFGLYCGMNLPVSMYPASSKPVVNMWVPYGTHSSDSFREDFGKTIESRIREISNSKIQVDYIDAYYEEDGAYFEVEFAWNTEFDLAKKEIESVAANISSSLPKEISDRIGVWQRNKNSGFFAASLYSPEMSLRDLFYKLEPILKPELDKITDAEQAVVWNPERYAVSVQLQPDKMTAYGLYPSDVKNAIYNSLSSLSGSQVKYGKQLQKFEIQASVNNVEELERLTLSHGNKLIYLKDIASIDYGRDLHRERSFKTNGINSLILFAKPKAGSNVKKMSEDILKVLKDNKELLPASLQTKVIVDPSTTIQNSINNLSKDVVVAACMSVLVLFLFIGGLKNIGTAAIEIPLSMILSFIFMKYTGMNLNLISLGGLALAAGMNVDASIVIMENIFRKRELWAKQNKNCETFSERVLLVKEAVSEVALPVILSIATTLIVFIPMAMTSDLTNAILGDLARAVIYSHAISGIVALVVVPTVRVVVLGNYRLQKAPLENFLVRLQKIHEKLLLRILDIPKIKIISIFGIFSLLTVLSLTIIPNLPKEVIGKPSSEWVYMYINAYDTQSSRHMENIMQEVEVRALDLLPGKVDYTWLEKHNMNGGQIMFRLFNPKDMKEAEEILKKEFINTPDRNYSVSNWNPAELPLPRENHFHAIIKGNEKDIYKTASKLKSYLKEKNIYDRIWENPNVKSDFSFIFKPDHARWALLNQNGAQISPSHIADISHLTKEPLKLGNLQFNGRSTDIKMSILDKRYQDPDQLRAYPIKIGEKIIPLNALGNFEVVKKPSRLLVRNFQPQIELFGTLEKDEKGWEKIFFKTKEDLEKNMSQFNSESTSIEIVYPQKDLKNALGQLSNSLLISIALIFLILWLQFQSIKQVGIIMMTIPFGIIGGLLALYCFGSFLSLNSALGIILLNGITVNNSILLTDVTNTLRASGLRGKDLVITATKKRLRPILITSLTTILGMFPIALGMGDGGKILQPLGIAVSCGLFIATALTLIIVPALLYTEEENLQTTDENIILTPKEFQTESQPIL